MALALVMLSVAGAAGAYYYWNEIEGLFTRQQLVLDPAGGGALNILVIGSDSRDAVDDPEDVRRFGTVGGNRADTVILVQVIPSERRGVLLSFPRDLWLTIPADPSSGRREQRSKINAAYNHGPQAVIDTVQRLTAIPINHYMEIDLIGFRQMVDAVGGIEVCLEQPMYDRKLNFRLPEGVNELDGNQALSFVRSRTSSPDGDFGRMRRQQQFMRAVVRKVGTPRVLGNPLRVNELARAFASNVTVDQHFNLDDMIRFAVHVQRIHPDQLTTYSVPGRIGRAGGQSVVLMNERESELIFQALRDGVDPKIYLEPPPPEGEAPPPADEPPAPSEPEPEGPCAGF